MLNNKPCKIRILNQSYEIKCPEHEVKNLQRAALKLEQVLLEKKNKFKSLSFQDLLLLSALQLSHELVTTHSDQDEKHEQLSQFISTLENKINQAVDDILPEDSV